MKERGIIYSAPMVIAYRANLKTQTRRTRGLDKINEAPDDWKLLGFVHERNLWWFSNKKLNGIAGSVEIRCPYGVAGDHLWTREAWAAAVHGSYEAITGPLSVGYYNVKIPWSFAVQYRANYLGRNDDYDGAWRPSIHMPRWASRDTAEIISARPERLRSITEADALAEGSFLGRCPCPEMRVTPKSPIELAFRQTGCHIHGTEFRALWESINGDGSWDQNPWVWRLEFRRLKQVDVG